MINSIAVHPLVEINPALFRARNTSRNNHACQSYRCRRGHEEINRTGLTRARWTRAQKREIERPGRFAVQPKPGISERVRHQRDVCLKSLIRYEISKRKCSQRQLRERRTRARLSLSVLLSISVILINFVRDLFDRDRPL